MIWVAILVSAAMAYAMRVSLLVLIAGRHVPPAVDRALVAVGPAVIAAMLTVNLLSVNNGQRVSPGQLIAVVVAIGIVKRTGNLLLGTAAGLLLVIASGWLVGAGL
jgi:branched-subunit amino acid transport protein